MLPRSVVALFCDDVREEKSGKETIVGIYPDNVNVPSFPYTFPRVLIYTRINTDVRDKIKKVEIRISLPEEETETIMSTADKKFVSETQKTAKKKGTPIVSIVGRVVASQMRVLAPGQVRLLVTVNDDEYVGGFINVQQTPNQHPTV
jgi:hypothetical protein